MAQAHRGPGFLAKNLLSLPEEVQDSIGHALNVAQIGETVDYAKPLHDMGSGVWEIVDDFQTDTFRGVYVVRFEGVKAFCTLSKRNQNAALGCPDATQNLSLAD